MPNSYETQEERLITYRVQGDLNWFNKDEYWAGSINTAITYSYLKVIVTWWSKHVEILEQKEDLERVPPWYVLDYAFFPAIKNQGNWRWWPSILKFTIAPISNTLMLQSAQLNFRLPSGPLISSYSLRVSSNKSRLPSPLIESRWILRLRIPNWSLNHYRSSFCLYSYSGGSLYGGGGTGGMLYSVVSAFRL